MPCPWKACRAASWICLHGWLPWPYIFIPVGLISGHYCKFVSCIFVGNLLKPIKTHLSGLCCLWVFLYEVLSFLPRHISRLLWVCCHVDPPTAFHWQPLHEVCHFSPEVFSKYFWSEGMWRVPRTSRKKSECPHEWLVVDCLYLFFIS